MEEIAPRLRAVIPQCVYAVGAEDAEELVQDGMTVAAQMLHALEARGKQVTAGNVTYYTILHLKSGRRSYGSGRTDVMGSATQLDNKSCVLSFEEEVGSDPELDEPIRLGELLTCSTDDPSMVAGRNMDWEEFLDSHDGRYGVIVTDILTGMPKYHTGKRCGVGYGAIRVARKRLKEDLAEYLGSDAIADSVKTPSW